MRKLLNNKESLRSNHKNNFGTIRTEKVTTYCQNSRCYSGNAQHALTRAFASCNAAFWSVSRSNRNSFTSHQVRSAGFYSRYLMHLRSILKVKRKRKQPQHRSAMLPIFKLACKQSGQGFSAFFETTDGDFFACHRCVFELAKIKLMLKLNTCDAIVLMS